MVRTTKPRSTLAAGQRPGDIAADAQLEDWNDKRPKFPFDELAKSVFEGRAGYMSPSSLRPVGRRLDELRLVANVVKHVEGDSANKLRAVNDAHFQATLGAWHGAGEVLRRPNARRAADRRGIYVVKADYDEFVTAAIDFWKWLAGLVHLKSR